MRAIINTWWELNIKIINTFYDDLNLQNRISKFLLNYSIKLQQSKFAMVTE